MKAAWERYYRKLAEVQSFIYSASFSNRAEVQLSGHDLMLQAQAVAYTLIMAARQDYPCLTTLTLGDPNIYPAALPNPDCKYRWATVHGDRTYRIWGKRGAARFLDFQVNVYDHAGQAASAGAHFPANYRLDQFQISADGSFEIIAGADEKTGNWIGLPQGVSLVNLTVREVFCDWVSERPAELHIEVVDDRPLGPFLLSEAEFIERLEIMGEMVFRIVNDWGILVTNLILQDSGGKTNIFRWMPRQQVVGTNNAANYAACIYDLADDEALIMEFDEPDALYWGVQLGNPLGDTTDYVYHQSSLNGHQARKDADGKIRMVLSKKDPGAPNWLDTVDYPYGVVLFRQYFFKASVGLPRTLKVDVSRVRDYLPRETPQVSREQRRAAIRARRMGILAQYGY